MIMTDQFAMSASWKALVRHSWPLVPTTEQSNYEHRKVENAVRRSCFYNSNSSILPCFFRFAAPRTVVWSPLQKMVTLSFGTWLAALQNRRQFCMRHAFGASNRCPMVTFVRPATMGRFAYLHAPPIAWPLPKRGKPLPMMWQLPRPKNKEVLLPKRLPSCRFGNKITKSVGHRKGRFNSFKRAALPLPHNGARRAKRGLKLDKSWEMRAAVVVAVKMRECWMVFGTITSCQWNWKTLGPLST
mmetsp:Transcript_10767/g.29725  ORF Transcript_10767/g.29725 Transcript_10767/m.29725 type:complete len:243 (-) Transcript_10767:1094-1822(-)